MRKMKLAGGTVLMLRDDYTWEPRVPILDWMARNVRKQLSVADGDPLSVVLVRVAEAIGAQVAENTRELVPPINKEVVH